ncbi:hypothetical protein CUMW_167850 [Citrus unshiu]|uniref:AIPP2-like SPOC-like domain-containing protein n=1 Tax=Citrus unshiu TaxID=55188 RepID=A0A2H5PU70_CITUN|nr:hypothetical protein CUMW_167850 [Citrus unshiu]
MCCIACYELTCTFNSHICQQIDGRRHDFVNAVQFGHFMLQVKPCDICGDGGWPEQIATCYLCKSAREHIYCMKFLLFSRPIVWFCEECRSIKGQVLPKSVVQELCHGALTSTDISSRDLRQSVGGPNVKLSTQSNLHSNHACQTDTLTTKSNGTPRFETSLSKLSPQEVNADPSVSHCNPLLGGIEEIHSITQQQVPQTSKELKGKNWIVCKEEPVEILEAMGSRVEVAADITPPPSVNALPIISSGKKFSLASSQCFDIQTSNLDPNDEPDNSFLLTSYAIWCGSIEMLSLDTSSKFYDGFWAYLPCKIHRKVLEFSKEMPGVISCSSVPCCNISLEVFQNDMPNIDDIALIFFPGNFQRSKEQYDSLLELLEMRDLVLKSCINGVELLIFSSKILQANSSGFKLGSFLWGVYHEVQGKLEVPPVLTHENQWQFSILGALKPPRAGSLRMVWQFSFNSKVL